MQIVVKFNIYTIGIKLSIFWNFGTNFLAHLNEQTDFISSEKKKEYIMDLFKIYSYCTFV